MLLRLLSRRSFANVVLGALTVGGTFAMLPAPAHAATAPKALTADLMVILASQTDAASADPSIAKLPALTAAPLKFYNTFKLLDRKGLPLEANKGVPYTVADGGPTLSLTLLEVIQEKDKDNKDKPPRYRVSAVLTSGKSSSTINIVASAGERVFVGGPSYKTGTLFFGVSVQ